MGNGPPFRPRKTLFEEEEVYSVCIHTLGAARVLLSGAPRERERERESAEEPQFDEANAGGEPTCLPAIF